MKLNLIGQTINSFSIVGQGPKKQYKAQSRSTWKCLCKCGNIFYAVSSGINTIKSCGCENYTGVHGNRKYTESESSFRGKVSEYKAAAKSSGKEWNLSIEEAAEIIKKECFYCGSAPSMLFDVNNKSKRKFKLNKSEIKYNGIDRIDSNKGYVKDNVVPCCAICNHAKNDLRLEDFLNWIKRLCAFHNKKYENEFR